MRILLVSDLHYSLPQLDWVVAAGPSFDAVVLAGDSLNISSPVPLDAQSAVVQRYLELIAAMFVASFSWPYFFYRSIFDAVRDFLHDEAFEGHDRIMTKYLKPDLLILDDMGLKQLPKRSGEYLFEIIMRRHQLHSTMMTSNRPLEDWGKLMNDVPAATAILDRFLAEAEILQITGKSYRLRGKLASDRQPAEIKND